MSCLMRDWSVIFQLHWLGHVTYPFIDALFCMFGHAAKHAKRPGEM